MLKFLGAHNFFTFGWIYFILGMVIDTDLKFLAASAFMTITLGSRSQTLNSYVKFLFLIF